jgi:type I restriction enzyme S subunit
VSVENLLPNKLGKTQANSVPQTGRLISFNPGDILIGNIRPYLQKIWLSNCYGGTNGDVLTIQIKDREKIDPRFLYYVLSSDSFFIYDNQNSKGAKMPRGDKNAIMKYRIPVPPLPVQERIVNILDRFDKLCNDISEGLPAEIEARQKQYEYYRDKLLTFKQNN